ncbi:MAG: toll/interleukin-1 receptor domain-containing protein, partial [bacterium]|nr:toll/interleukin-1 receptor domain-containing protein [bacterium]
MCKKKIFISYAHEDEEAARRLFRHLKEAKFEPWLDKENILPGQLWAREIEEAIKESAYFLALVSSNSTTKRGFVQRELRLAMSVVEELPEGSIYVIPVRLEECRMYRMGLEKYQWIDLFPSLEIGISKLIAALKEISVLNRSENEDLPSRDPLNPAHIHLSKDSPPQDSARAARQNFANKSDLNASSQISEARSQPKQDHTRSKQYYHIRTTSSNSETLISAAVRKWHSFL